MKQFKLGGLLVVLALTLAASVGVSSALAEFHSESEQTTWSGTPIGTQHFSFGGESLDCNSGLLSGGSTSAHNTESLTLSPQISGCSYFGVGTTWAIHGCKFQLRGSHFSITNCTSPMSWTISSAGSTCSLQLGNQGGRTSVTYTNSGSGSSRTTVATMSITGLTYTRSGTCGPTGTFNNGIYTAEWKLSGKLTGTSTQTGVWADSYQSATHEFRAESAPVVLGGSQLGTQTLSVAGNALKCNGVSYKGEAGSTSNTSLTVTPTYSGCTFYGAPPTLSMGGCAYEFNASGSLSIVGANCAAEPITIRSRVFFGTCNVTVGPQTVSAVGYENVGSGVVANENISGLQYTATGELCNPSGSQSSGTLTGSSVLTATTSGGNTQALWLE